MKQKEHNYQSTLIWKHSQNTQKCNGPLKILQVYALQFWSKQKLGTNLS